MAENYKLLYEQMKKIVTEYQDKVVPCLRDIIKYLEQNQIKVRCKDCKHYKPRNRSARWDCKTPCCNRSAALKFPEDGFCSYGERRTE